MQFERSDEQNMIVETARRVGEKFGLDYWREIDASKTYPTELWQEICNAGICSIAIPEADGGAGLGMLEMAMAVETLCAAGGGSTLSQLFMVNPIFGGVTLSKYGSAQQKRLLSGIMDGSVTFCMALTEPDAGSNSLSISTFASSCASGWKLNGRKIWITSVPQSTKILVVARTKRPDEVERKTDGISLFMIDSDRKGIEHAPIDKAGTRALPSSTIFFDDVEIRSDELIGTLDKGWHQLLDTLNTERMVTTAGLLGTADLAVRLAVDYAKERKVFRGVPIGSYQALQFPLAEAHIQAQCARLMNYKAASLHDRGLACGSEANQAKWLAGHAAGQATDRALQTLGGMGYSKEYHIERLWRDARLFRLAPVSEEMVLNFVAQHDLGLPRSY
ncbi:acyl-CoA dehydrogenase [Sphingobium lactosutens]|uniref:acyl-CoA dehydrogenase family protein n=1 Tax=Sphingobium lactosutens TaxID=522773 RepID=UPI0015BB6C56|nr:acyl-CoA dehydrogenase family protein [Sphingobium lactosutens]NWK97425.1 acyl-CoA dehydrogenase [Sphingobium lactosutens]